jgi:M6 family metalloprotease-like protein
MGKTICRLIFIGILLLLRAENVLGLPACRNLVRLTQANGTTLHAYLKGDEFGHIVESVDGYVLKKNSSGSYTYALQRPDGSVQAGPVTATNPSQRSLAEKAYLATLQPGLTFPKAFQEKRLSERLSRLLKSEPGLRKAVNATGYGSSEVPPGLMNNAPRTGSPKTLVILVNFEDLTFQAENNPTSIDRFLNQNGYADNGHNGSVKDYFTYNSAGLFSPDFVVVGPVTVPGNRNYYGQNSSEGDEIDLYVPQLIQEACKAVDSTHTVRFSDFDADGDGAVDNVCLFYAGSGEADGGGDSTIWPRSSKLEYDGATFSLGGKTINSYICIPELSAQTNAMDGIGSFTHEFAHQIGLPDMYDVDYDTYNGEGFDLCEWSLMAYGAYNNEGRTPPCLSVVERSLLGWCHPTVLDTTCYLSLPDMGSTNIGYKIPTSHPGEYYLLENRQTEVNPWDAYLPYHGMLVYHIDLRSNADTLINYWGNYYTFTYAELWQYNMVNALAGHPCCDLEEADNERIPYQYENRVAYWESLCGDPFPGKKNNTVFSDATQPSMRTWSGEKVEAPLSRITEVNDTVSFQFKDLSQILQPPSTLTASWVKPYAFSVRWNTPMPGAGYAVSVYRKTNTLIPCINDSIVTDTTFSVSVPDTGGTYRIRICSIKQGIRSSDSIATDVTTPAGRPNGLAATAIKPHSFRANWQSEAYAVGYYVDVYTLDALKGDTVFVEGYRNRYTTVSMVDVYNLNAQATYWYRVRGTDGSYTSTASVPVSVTTKQNAELRAYSAGSTLFVDGVDANGRIRVYSLDGTLMGSTSGHSIVLPAKGVYLITAPHQGKLTSLKVTIE